MIRLTLIGFALSLSGTALAGEGLLKAGAKLTYALESEGQKSTVVCTLHAVPDGPAAFEVAEFKCSEYLYCGFDLSYVAYTNEGLTFFNEKPTRATTAADGETISRKPGDGTCSEQNFAEDPYVCWEYERGYTKGDLLMDQCVVKLVSLTPAPAKPAPKPHSTPVPSDSPAWVKSPEKNVSIGSGATRLEALATALAGAAAGAKQICGVELAVMNRESWEDEARTKLLEKSYTVRAKLGDGFEMKMYRSTTAAGTEVQITLNENGVSLDKALEQIRAKCKVREAFTGGQMYASVGL